MTAQELSTLFDEHFWKCEPCRGVVMSTLRTQTGKRMCELGRKMITQWSEANVVEANLRNGLSQ